jgi:signal transduction histidine kinase
MMSLRLRLLLGAIVGVVAALSVAAVILGATFETHVRKRYVEELDEHLLQLAALVQHDTDGAVSLRHQLYNDAFQKPLSGLYWQVNDTSGPILRSKSLWDSDLVVSGTSSAPGQRQVSNVMGPRKQSLIAVERIVLMEAQPPRPLRLIVAGESKVVEESRAEFTTTVAYLVAAIGTLLGFASWVQVGAGLAPLTALRRQLEQLRHGRVERIDGRFPEEIAGLVDDLNRLTSTQSREVERARANAGKLGHGLKTPLAVVAAECRGLRARNEAATADAIERQIEEMNAHIARVIASARAVGPRKTFGTRAPVRQILQRMLAVMKRLPRGSELDWRLSVEPADLAAPIDPRDLEELLGNLLDNARKWAKSRVEITAMARAGSIEVSVDDDGPGIPEDRRDDVLAGGFRLDRAVPGSGIGLAISGDLATLHGGSLRIGPSPLGGTRSAVSIGAQA